MKRYLERRLCRGCEGHGMIDPPYGDESTGVAKQTCPCCGGTGYQEVEIREE